MTSAQSENVLENVRARSPELMSGLKKIQKKFPQAIKDVRGVGLMIAVEFVDTPGVATAVSQAALNHELMLLTAVCICVFDGSFPPQFHACSRREPSRSCGSSHR